MNASEAERCIDIAVSAQRDGDIAKAERFLQKSISMHSTPRAVALLAQLNSAQHIPPSPSPPPQQPSSSSPSASPSSSAPSSSTNATFTSEQRSAAVSMSKLRNYYEVLAVTRTASDTEIKSSYRRLAMQFHPDKNRAPEAEDAFKLVSAAYQCLSDPRKRAHYDQFGEDEAKRTASATPTRGNTHFARDEDLSPEEIFNLFFGNLNGIHGGGGGRRVYTTRRRHNIFESASDTSATNGAGNGGGSGFPLNIMQFAHFLPVLLLIIITLLNAPTSSDDTPFSLTSTSTYNQHRKTESSHFDYYVSPSFRHIYARDRRALLQVESAVERETIKRLREQCNKEMDEAKRTEREAQHSKEPRIQALDKAHSPKPSCVRLQNVAAVTG